MSRGADVVDSAVRTDLQTLNDEFFISLRGGTSRLLAFVDSWATFSSTVNCCRDKLRSETVDMIYAFASTVAVVASNLIECQSISDDVSQQMATDITQILEDGVGRLSISSSLSTEDSAYPLYIKPSYEWLLAHLHNPYPTKDTRIRICQETRCSIKDVDAWFIDARKRIGWNALRKVHFSNKRTEIVDAATRFFVQYDSKRPLEPAIELQFASIESHARELYSDKFTESSLATKLDITVRDMTPKMKDKVKAEKKLQKLRERRRRDKPTQAALSYPSPDHSPEPGLEHFLPSSPDQDTHSLPVGVRSSNLKRRNSVTGNSDVEEELSTRKPSKRSRVETPISLQDVAALSLPSPAASLCEVSSESSVLALPPVANSSSSTAKRKRRLSESDGQNASKRSRNLNVVPRLQTTSNPFPLPSTTSSFDEWFQSIFNAGIDAAPDIPAAVTVEAPDATAPLEIEIYNFSSDNSLEASSPDAFSSVTSHPVITTSVVFANDATRACVYSDDDTFSWFDTTNCGISNPFAQEVGISCPNPAMPSDISSFTTPPMQSLSHAGWDDTNFPTIPPLDLFRDHSNSPPTQSWALI